MNTQYTMENATIIEQFTCGTINDIIAEQVKKHEMEQLLERYESEYRETAEKINHNLFILKKMVKMGKLIEEETMRINEENKKLKEQLRE